MMYRRRRLMLRSMAKEKKLYLYNGGQVNGRNFTHKPEWNITSSNTSVQVTDGVEYSGRTVLTVQLYDRNTSGAAGVSLVESVGVLGADLKKYKTLNVDFVQTITMGFAPHVSTFYTSLDGKDYYQYNVAFRWEATSQAGNTGHTLTWDISELAFNDDTRYYFGQRFQTGKAQSNSSTQQIYITSVWLE